MNPESPIVICLREKVELKAGRAIRTPKDFDYLREALFDEQHELVSVSTLKRIWGYIAHTGELRESSLLPLIHYAGYEDMLAMQADIDGADGAAIQPSEVQPSDVQPAVSQLSDVVSSDVEPQPTPSRYRVVLAGVVAVLLLAAAGGWWLCRGDAEVDLPAPATARSLRVLHKGADHFATIDDYLDLFGVAPSDTAYYRPVPGLHKVFVWGPEYGHPVWHNEGDKSQLLPTITEYWTPVEGTEEYYSDEYVVLANEKLYFEHMIDDELRITFVRNLTEGGGYLFCGVYRMDTAASSRQRIVWRRVSDHVDLSDLKGLEALRR